MISVIIPSYNRANLIGETIESVINQSYSKWELIIVDDGSTDNSDAIIEEYLKTDNRIKYVRRPSGKPSGGNGARNYGFEIAKGDYVKWLDSDDLLDPECLELQARSLENKNAEVVFCRSKEFTLNAENTEIILRNFWHPVFPNEEETHKELLEDFVLGKYRFSNNDGLWDKKLFKKPPYNEQLKNSQEWLMIIEALSQNPNIQFLNKTLVLIRAHQDQMPYKRRYSSFVLNQCYSRYLALQTLKQKKILTKAVSKYLLKSMLYYLLKQIQKLDFRYLDKSFFYFFKSLKMVLS